MHHRKAQGQDLLRLKEVAQVRTREIPARRAVALLVDRLLVELVLLVFEVDRAAPREELAVACVARRHHTVKKVHAARHALDDVRRRTDAHEIARLILRHIGLDRVDDVVHCLRRLADREAADGVAVTVELCDLFHVPDAKIFERRTLVDAK